MTQIDPYNPLDLQALGHSLLLELERRPTTPLKALSKFVGSGIYGLYYTGSAKPYAQLGKFNQQHGCLLPLYVGRSKDTGARQGLDPFEPVKKALLYGRVQEHRRNVEAAAGIQAGDFVVRTLVAMPIWIPLAEAMAIRVYRPVWNSSLQGFGIHAPGSGRAMQKQSDWDLLHPGRAFAKALPKSAVRTREELLARTEKAARESIDRFRKLRSYR